MDINPLEIARQKFQTDAFASLMGIVLDEIGPSHVKMHMPLDARLCNFYKRPHGAAMYALADAAFSVIGNNNNVISVALECSISYHASPDPGHVLHVEGREVAGTRKTGTYLFTLYTMEGNERIIVATMKSTLYKTGKRIVDAGDTAGP